MKVIWTFRAEESFNGIVDYLLEVWNGDIARAFVDEVDRIIASLADNPEMFKGSQYNPQSGEAYIARHTTLYYRVVKGTIEIEYFWGNLDNPEKITSRLRSE